MTTIAAAAAATAPEAQTHRCRWEPPLTDSDVMVVTSSARSSATRTSGRLRAGGSLISSFTMHSLAADDKTALLSGWALPGSLERRLSLPVDDAPWTAET